VLKNVIAVINFSVCACACVCMRCASVLLPLKTRQQYLQVYFHTLLQLPAVVMRSTKAVPDQAKSVA
jgi:hypothetical protein